METNNPKHPRYSMFEALLPGCGITWINYNFIKLIPRVAPMGKKRLFL
jgi:hypothetical protein